MPGGHVSYQGSSLKTNPKDLVAPCSERQGASGTAPVRLWVKGTFQGYKRGIKNSLPHCFNQVARCKRKEGCRILSWKETSVHLQGKEPKQGGQQIQSYLGKGYTCTWFIRNGSCKVQEEPSTKSYGQTSSLYALPK